MSYEGLIFICLLFTVYCLPLAEPTGTVTIFYSLPQGGAVGALNLFKRGVLLAATLEVGILEELYEGESHGMHEGTDHAEGKGDTMSGQQDEDHRKPTDKPRHTAGEVESK